MKMLDKKKINIFFISISLVGALALAIGTCGFVGVGFGGPLLGILLVIDYLMARRIQLSPTLNLRKVVVSAVLMILAGYLSIELFDAGISEIAYGWQLATMIGTGLFFSPLCYLIANWYFGRLEKVSHDRYVVVAFGTALFLGLFIVTIYLPFSTFFSNVDEFGFSYYILAIACVPRCVCVLVLSLVFAVLLSKKVLYFVVCLLSGLDVAIYCQYMFFNRYLTEIDGKAYMWSDHLVYSIVNIIVWTMVLGFFCFSGIYHSKDDKVRHITNIITSKRLVTGSVFLLLVQLVALVSMIVTAPDYASKMQTYTYLSDDQYKVAKDENVILFVLDAVDNRYIQTLLDENREVFDDYQDFTLYDNTCSVYDFTGPSMHQMLTGYCYGDETNYASDFYERIKAAGYVVNFYGIGQNSDFPSIEPYIDNCEVIYYDLKNSGFVDYAFLFDNTLKMSCYQILPCVLKGMVDAEQISYDCFTDLGVTNDILYQNEEYASALKLEVDENKEKYFVMQHINGAHFPCDDYVETTARCLEICGEYINQLRANGLYDNATIIITADHGLHDHHPPYVWPTAGTPVFMIKESETHHEKIVISHAPIYHKDLLSTLLVNMKLFNYEDDYDKFGTSIYDYDDDSVRERLWYNRTSSGYQIYTYTGDTMELNRVVDEGIYTISE